MSYSSLLAQTSPRIYLNIPEYLSTIFPAEIFPIHSTYKTLPVHGNVFNTVWYAEAIYGSGLMNKLFEDFTDYTYIAFLNHRFSSYAIDTYASSIDNGEQTSVDKGYSISKLSGLPTSIAVTTDQYIGSVLIGTYYTFPNSADMNISASIEYESVKKTTTKSGNELTNAPYNRPTFWGDRAAWELGNSWYYRNYAKTGRRVWDLSFSYSSDSDIFPENAGLSNELPADTTKTLLQSDTLQRVIHLTQGGSIPFIFQTQTSSIVGGQDFAIAMFDMKSFKFNQVANGVYDIGLKIREVW